MIVPKSQCCRCEKPTRRVCHECGEPLCFEHRRACACRVRELAGRLLPFQIEFILDAGQLVDPLGSLRTPTDLGTAVMEYVRREHGNSPR